jgi:hypothetical protein
VADSPVWVLSVVAAVVWVLSVAEEAADAVLVDPMPEWSEPVVVDASPCVEPLVADVPPAWSALEVSVEAPEAEVAVWAV